MDQLSLGVLATSSKENEFRLPIHPQHFDRIDADLRARIFLERGYGDRYGVSDEHLRPQVAGMRSREEIIATTDVVLLPKPTLDDLAGLRDGQVLWGWPHAVQDAELTQIAIDKRLTLIAWEAMNHWTPSGDFIVHVFHMNNELAGYCSVLHAMTLDRVHRSLRAPPHGRGHRLRQHRTRRDHRPAGPRRPRRHGAHHARRHGGGLTDPVGRARPPGPHRGRSLSRPWSRRPTGPVPTATFLARHDIVVNCVLQDTDAPLMFVSDDELAAFPRAACSSTCPATPAWGSSSPGPPPSRSRCSPSATGSPTTAWTTARLPVEQRDLGHQRGTDPLPAHRDGRARGVGPRSDHPAGHRDPRRRRAEPQDPLVPGPLPRPPAPPTLNSGSCCCDVAEKAVSAFDVAADKAVEIEMPVRLVNRQVLDQAQVTARRSRRSRTRWTPSATPTCWTSSASTSPTCSARPVRAGGIAGTRGL